MAFAHNESRDFRAGNSALPCHLPGSVVDGGDILRFDLVVLGVTGPVAEIYDVLGQGSFDRGASRRFSYFG